MRPHFTSGFCSYAMAWKFVRFRADLLEDVWHCVKGPVRAKHELPSASQSEDITRARQSRYECVFRIIT